MLTLTIDGIAVDVQWEDNDTISELLDYVKDEQSGHHESTANFHAYVSIF